MRIGRAAPLAPEAAGGEALPALERPAPSGPFAALAISSFRWLFLSTMCGVIGFQMQQVAMGWLVYELTHSALKLGLVTAAQAITQLGVSPVAGVIADRVERRNYIIVVRLVTVAVGAALTVLIWTHEIQYWQLLAGAAIIGIGFGLNGPARQALLADLVGPRYLLNAVSLNSAGMNVTRIVGPSVAGVLLGVVGAGGVFAANTALYATVILFMVPVPRRFATRERTKEPLLTELSGGVSYIRERPDISAILLVGTLPLFFAMPYVALLPIFATTVWHSGAIGFGLLSSAPGLGGAVGGVMVGSIAEGRRKAPLMLAGVIAYGALLVAFALSPSIYLALPLLALIGFAAIVYTSINATLVQLLTPNAMRGRVMSFYQMSFGLGQFGALPASALAQVAGAPATMAVAGGAVVVLGVAFARFSRPLRTL